MTHWQEYHEQIMHDILLHELITLLRISKYLIPEKLLKKGY